MTRSLVFALLLSLLSSPAWSLTLSWQPVTTSAAGTPLPPEFAVKEYRVYRCDIPTGCTKSTAKLIATVLAPATSVDVANQSPQPPRYFVSAVNIVAESMRSADLVLPVPAAPKSLVLK